MVDNVSDGLFELLETETRDALSCSGSAFPPSPVQAECLFKYLIKVGSNGRSSLGKELTHKTRVVLFEK